MCIRDSANAPAVSRGQALFLLGLGLSLTAYGWSFSGFRVGGMLAAALLMAAAKCLSPASAAAAGAVAGLAMDLFTGDAVLLTAVCCGGMGAASAVRERGRLAVPLVYTAAAMAVYTLLDGPDPLPLLFQSMAGAGLYLLLPQRLPLRLAQQAPVPPAQPEATPAAAFRAVYDSFFTEVSPPRPENPAVLFDRAAEQICAGCLLQRDCWQAHYNDTYNAFNDACPRLLRRGSACAEDFPLHFASRCLHFPQLLEALNDQLHQFLLRRAHRLQLEEAYQMARQQYAQMSEVLSPGMPVSAPPRFTCRTAIALRPKEGETLCGDQAASFETGGAACLLLSDGMGSGEACLLYTSPSPRDCS